MTPKQQQLLQEQYDQAKASKLFTQEDLDKFYIGFPVPPIVK